MKKIIVSLIIISSAFFTAGCQQNTQGNKTVIPESREQKETVKPVEKTTTSTLNILPSTEEKFVSSAETTKKAFLVALEDDGKSGKKIGCGDSAVPIDVTILKVDSADTSKTKVEMGRVIRALFDIKDQYYGESGLYNSLYQSKLDQVSIKSADGKNVTMNLKGEFMLGGTCDSPRFEAQLKETIMAFEGVESVDIFINDETIADYLSQK
jgi:hypothetical protein